MSAASPPCFLCRFEIALGSTQAVQVATESNTTIDTIDVDGWDE